MSRRVQLFRRKLERSAREALPCFRLFNVPLHIPSVDISSLSSDRLVNNRRMPNLRQKWYPFRRPQTLPPTVHAPGGSHVTLVEAVHIGLRCTSDVGRRLVTVSLGMSVPCIAALNWNRAGRVSAKETAVRRSMGGIGL